ncbi:MAG TPA: type II CAAX endopeptidase family protein [bacterium]|jgi:membrane protease YdiL (CAAX protease family)
MDELRLNRKDGLFITVCLIILVAGLLVGLRYFKQAFPEAAVDFRYDRGQTREMAQAYLQSLDLAPPQGYHAASRFSYDDDAKTYLEKELGVDSARRYLGHPVRLWYWQHRWFRPSTKEEFRVYVTPEGEVVQLLHEVEEQAPGADLAEHDARVIAERFLFGPMKQDSTKLIFLEAQRTGRPHRSDWAFTYKAVGIEPVKGSDYRYTVGLIGDRIGSYSEFLHVPQAWEASFERLRSYNTMAGSLDGIGLLLTAVAMVVVVFQRLRRRDIHWRTAVTFGVICAVLVLLNHINEIPLTLYSYDTTTSWSGFWTSTILSGILSAIGMGLAIMLMTAAAETVYREQYPQKLALPRMFSAQGLRTKRAFKSILLGVTLTSFFFSYQIAFYLIAGHFGAWSPSDVPYDNLLNTAAPWLAVLFMGFFPAVSEEFMSRMFSIPFLQKLFRNRYTWLALVIPAVIWGFGHATYPNEPFYIRGLEVGLAGIVIGVIMLKYGILATLVWHYTVDALYTAMLLFRSHNPYFVMTAAVAVGLLVLPMLVALVAYLRKGHFAPEEGVRNGDMGTAAEEAPVAAPVEVIPVGPVHYQPLPSNRRALAILLLIVGIALSFLPVARVGDFLSYPVTKQTATRLIADTLRATGWANPDTLQMAAFSSLGQDENAGKSDPRSYILKHVGSVEEFNRIADQRLHEGRWRVLAWVPENRLQFIGAVNSRTAQVEGLIPLLP